MDFALSRTRTRIASAKCNKADCVYGLYVYNLYLIECIRQNKSVLFAVLISILGCRVTLAV